MESNPIQRRGSDNRVDNPDSNDPKIPETAPSVFQTPRTENGARQPAAPILESGPDAVCSSYVQMEICSETSNSRALACHPKK
jgi:hypothetical protein